MAETTHHRSEIDVKRSLSGVGRLMGYDRPTMGGKSMGIAGDHQSNVLRDADIRHALEEWLLERHAGEPDTKILHELQIPRPSARIDLAVVNGRLAGFEIKSDVDGAARLGRQAASYSQVFERMTLVLTQRHAVRLPSRVPDWWEVVVCDGRGFRIRRRGRLNRSLCLPKLLHILNKTELLEVEWLAKGSTGPKSRRKQTVIDDIVAAGSAGTVRSAVRAALKRRP